MVALCNLLTWKKKTDYKSHFRIWSSLCLISLTSWLGWCSVFPHPQITLPVLWILLCLSASLNLWEQKRCLILRLCALLPNAKAEHTLCFPLLIIQESQQWFWWKGCIFSFLDVWLYLMQFCTDSCKVASKFSFYLLANISTLLNSAASKHRGGKHFSLIRSLRRMCKSAKAGTGYAQREKSPASTRAWQDYAVHPTVPRTALCHMVLWGESERKLKAWIWSQM